MRISSSRNWRRLPQRTTSDAYGFTLVELLVVISIIVLLISILLPALKQARMATIAVSCQSNMRQLSIITANYINDFNNRFPRTGLGNQAAPDGERQWWLVFDAAGYQAPPRRGPASDTQDRPGDPSIQTYAYNTALGREDWTSWSAHAVASPTEIRDKNFSKVIIFSESYNWFYWNSFPSEGIGCGIPRSEGGRLSVPHNESQNIAFLDGHAEQRLLTTLSYKDWLLR